MQHTDKMREEFEAWAGSEAFGLSPAHFAKDEAGDYINYPTQCYWMVWQASRAELVIELPAKPDADTFTRVQSAYWQGIDKVAGQAEAAGVTVRG